MLHDALKIEAKYSKVQKSNLRAIFLRFCDQQVSSVPIHLLNRYCISEWVQKPSPCLTLDAGPRRKWSAYLRQAACPKLHWRPSPQWKLASKGYKTLETEGFAWLWDLRFLLADFSTRHWSRKIPDQQLASSWSATFCTWLRPWGLIPCQFGLPTVTWLDGTRLCDMVELEFRM